MTPPNPIVRMMQAAVQAHQSGHLAEAEQGYRQVLNAEPRNPDALHLLGLLAYQCGQTDPAITLIERAVAINPNQPIFLVNLGQAYRVAGQVEKAENTLRRAIQLDAQLPEAHSNLSALLRQIGRLDEAEAAARKALSINPRLSGAMLNLGAVLKDNGELEAALQHYEQALKLGSPPHEVLNNQGEALRALGRLRDAELAFAEAIKLAPSMPILHWNLSLIHLLEGHWTRGFAEYEWRLKLNNPPQLPMPMWDGSHLAGRSILLHTEQGFGDAIQFVRYVPVLAAQGAHVVVQCQSELVRLFKTIPGIGEVLPQGQPSSLTDVHAPLLSLPYLFNTTPQSVAGTIPYLSADPADVAMWKPKIPVAAGVRNVGLVWSGNPRHSNDRNRSISADHLAPLTAVADVNWFSLQMNAAHADIAKLGLNDLSGGIRDFADTAAILSLLDLLITVDTAPAHLSGALGKPTWLLLPKVPDWRWLLERNDSVWYPTMRLFRQRERGDWPSVIAAVVEALNAG